MTDTGRDQETDNCGECPLATSRRVFLRDVGLSVVATLAAMGLSPGTSLADLVAEVSPLRTSAALRSYALPSADRVLVDDANDVIIVRHQRSVYAFSRRCPHKGARLVWRESEDRIFCPKHKARFTRDGDHASGRSSRNLDRFAVQLQGRAIIVDTRTLYREDRDPEQWSGAVISV